MMSVLEDTKRALEQVTGVGVPKRSTLRSLVRTRAPRLFRFKDDGKTPNNPTLPLTVYRSAVVLRGEYDPAAIFELLFATNGWNDSWRNGIYDFLHFHTRTHEVLGIARGWARVQFGGARGRAVSLKAGDVAVLPAGTGHRRIAASRDLLVVGAYPASGKYDEPEPLDIEHDAAVHAIAKVRLPRKDPVYGKDGPLLTLWKMPART